MRDQQGLFRGSSTDSAAGEPNLSEKVLTYLSMLGLTNYREVTKRADLIWMHALAIGFAPGYLSENSDGVRQDWPRIPLPDSKSALLHSAELGCQIAALLDTENPVVRVTTGSIRPELKEIAVISRDGGGSLEPAKGLSRLDGRMGPRRQGWCCDAG